MSITIKKGMPWDIAIPSPPQMSEEGFYELANALPDLLIERDKDGNIFIMPPVHFDTGGFESEAQTELGVWNRKMKAGKVFASNTGFVLPNGAMRSPDAAWISNERLATLPRAERKKFAHICPDFVIEIRSDFDNLQPVKDKMAEYMENGARLGFLIDPKGAQAFIYRPDSAVEHITGLEGALSGEPILPGFSLPLYLFKSE